MKRGYKIICFVMLFANTIFAQINYRPATISSGLKTLLFHYPNNFKMLSGKDRNEKWNSFDSKLKLPNSVVNRIDIASSTEWPLIFMSIIPAGNDKEKAIVTQKKICNEVLAVKLNYLKDKFDIILKADESNQPNEELVYVYKIDDAPPEYLETRIIVRLDDAVKKPYKYQITISVAYINDPTKY